MTKDQWAWWKSALAGKMPEIHEDDPQSGFYRVRRSKTDRTFEPVAIWRDKDGTLIATRGGRKVDAYAIWTWACRSPVSEQEYRKVEAGGEWSDAPPPVAVAGHNLPADDAERLALLLREEAAAIQMWLADGAIDNEDRAAAAAELTKRVTAFAKESEGLRAAQKEPHLKAGREIDAKWKPIVAGFEDLNRTLKRAMDDYLRAKKRELEEQARAEGPVFEAPKASVGNIGATVTLRSYKSARITDPAAFLAAQGGNPVILEAAQKVANALARAGATCPGMEIVTEERAA